MHNNNLLSGQVPDTRRQRGDEEQKEEEQNNFLSDEINLNDFGNLNNNIINELNNIFTGPDYATDIAGNHVKIDKKYFRPCEVDLLIGDATKARNVLNWMPEYNLEALIESMFENN